jgi:hypothetical protein
MSNGQTKPLVSCSVCQGSMSTRAWACPHCGDPRRTPRVSRPAGVGGWTALLGLWLCVTVLLMYGMPDYALIIALVSAGLFVRFISRSSRDTGRATDKSTRETDD